MTRFILKNAWGFYLGAGLSCLGFPFYTWQFYAFSIPLIVLVTLSQVMEAERR